MEQMLFMNNGSNAYAVTEHLSGKQNIIVLLDVSTGSGCGSLKIVL
jgi:hypothetical protein